jgi:hypothetical protein
MVLLASAVDYNGTFDRLQYEVVHWVQSAWHRGEPTVMMIGEQDLSTEKGGVDLRIDLRDQVQLGTE